MKKLLLSLSTLFFIISMRAQVIQNNSYWFDGIALYNAKVSNDMVYFRGESVQDNNLSFTLRRENTKPGAYVICQDKINEPSLIRAEVGWKVQYIRKEGMYFLAVKNQKEEIVWTLVLTPDNLENCLSSQDWAMEQPLEDMASNYLMNAPFLFNFSKDEIKQQADRLAKKSKRSIIEETNLSLMKSELNGANASQTDNITRVSTEKEFIAALKNSAQIVIAKGSTLNLSKILYNKEFFSASGRAYDYYSEALTGAGCPVILSEPANDGRQLTILNLNDVTIRGEDNVTILVDPRYAYVLNFINCQNITLENLTLGHTDIGHCEAGVIGMKNCNWMNIVDCDMFGCGAYGIIATNVNSLDVSSSIIRDCSYGIMELLDCLWVTFADCNFIRNKEYTMVFTNSNCRNILFNNCWFAQNKGRLFHFETEVKFANCLIMHSEKELCEYDSPYIYYVDNKTHWKFNDDPLPDRNIGPTSVRAIMKNEDANEYMAKVAMYSSKDEALNKLTQLNQIEPVYYGDWKKGEQTIIVIPASKRHHLEIWSADFDDKVGVIATGKKPLAEAVPGQPLCFSFTMYNGMPRIMVICTNKDGYKASWVPSISGKDGSLETDSEFIEN